MISEVHAVTISTQNLRKAREIYETQLGMRPLIEWKIGQNDLNLARLWDLKENLTARCIWLNQPNARHGGVRLVEFQNANSKKIIENARAYDFGYVKNLDFFTDQVEAAYKRFADAGHIFLSPPVTYEIAWGEGVTATEAHLPTDEGVKISLARMNDVPRRIFGESNRETAFTEVAAATMIVENYDESVNFYKTVFDCVPAAETIVDAPELIRTLKLPVGTRLRLSFIGHAKAVGGKIGIVAYEGDGVRDARSLREQNRLPNLGVAILTFLTDELDYRHALALANDASEVCPPTEFEMPLYGAVRASSFRSPDGVLHELIQKETHKENFAPVLSIAELTIGTLRQINVPQLGRIVLANVNNQVFAVQDRCPHLNAPLSNGKLEGARLTCPWHGWQIDVTTGRVCNAENLLTRRFETKITDNQIWINIISKSDKN